MLAASVHSRTSIFTRSSSMSIYCVYLTCYRGNKLPPFYIGYSTVKKVNNGYRGTIQSKKYKTIFQQELKDNPHLFKTFIISKCVSRDEALKRESDFQRHFSVHKNSMYINMAISNKKFYCTDHSFKRTESYGRKVSANNKKRWADPVEREFWMRALKSSKNTDAYKKKQSKISKRLAQDPVYIESLSNGVKASWEKEGERERRSKIMKDSYDKNPEFREAKKRKKWWTDDTTSVLSEACPPGFRRGRTFNKN